MDDSFLVRQACSFSDLKWIMDNKEHYPLKRERITECLFAAGMTSHYLIGELSGQKISCIGMRTYNDRYVYVTPLFVITQFRGKGYAKRTWQLGMAHIRKKGNLNIGFNAKAGEESGYEKGGCSKRYTAGVYTMNAGVIANSLPDLSDPQGIAIVPGCEADINKVDAYTEKSFGASSKSLLASYISLETSISFAACDPRQSHVVGLIILMKAEQKPSYIVSVFLSETLDTAKTLLKKCADCMLPLDPCATITTCSPRDNLPCIQMLVDDFRASVGIAFSYMSTIADQRGSIPSVYSIFH